MKIKKMAILFALVIIPHISHAALFDIDFDNNPDGLPNLPIVGSGSFGFDGVATDGVFALSSLSNFNFNFDFSGNTFSNANILTPIEDVLVVISNFGSQVNFANLSEGLFDTGRGSIDFINFGNKSESVLSFEPSDGNLPLPSLYFTDKFFGDYSSSISAVPAPAAIWLFSFGLGLIGFLRMRKKPS